MKIGDVMTYEVDIRADVPLYGQESCCWCGAACGQMIMNGYPDPVHRKFFPQIDVWNTIQAYNSATEPVPWCADPQGLQECLMTLNYPPGGSWNIFMDTVRDNVMFGILYWMNQKKYPAATLINAGGHWVTIVRYVTDVEPVYGSSLTLQEITKYDPEPHNVGTETTMTASTWYSTDWQFPVLPPWYADFQNSNLYKGMWDNCWVAVVEPPKEKAKVNVEMVKRMGEKIIKPDEAVNYAMRWIAELQLGRKYPVLQKEGMTHLQPILVHQQFPGPKAGPTRGQKEITFYPSYYIVPFGFENEEGFVRVSIIVNAYTGKFEEIGAFGRPVQYLPEKKAIDIAAKAMRLTREEMMEVKARMIFQPSELTHIRTYPFWEIAVKERFLYIDQLGAVYRVIKPSMRGD